MKKPFLLIAALISLSACTRHEGENQYGAREVGISKIIEFGTVMKVREVGITGKPTGTGTLLGAAAGAGGGSFIGSGGGSVWGAAGGAVVGAVAGSVAEQAAANRTGIEYTITRQDGKLITLVQNKNEGDTIFPVGARVMVQTSGSYQRVLPADGMPDQVKRAQGMRVVDY